MRLYRKASYSWSLLSRVKEALYSGKGTLQTSLASYCVMDLLGTLNAYLDPFYSQPGKDLSLIFRDQCPVRQQIGIDPFIGKFFQDREKICLRNGSPPVMLKLEEKETA